MAEEPNTAIPAETAPAAVEQIVPDDPASSAPVETDLLGDPVVGEQAPLTLEDRVAALEALTQKLLDYGAALQVGETQARIADLEAKLERIAATAARPVHPRTLDELPSPFAPAS